MSKDHHQNKTQEEKIDDFNEENQEEENQEEVLVGSSDDQKECKTPTSADHKITAVKSCPPTPTKKSVQLEPLIFHKRKFSDTDFFEDSNRDEVDSFFQSSFDQIHESSKRSKRRCRSC
ncbi:hypothetical protein M5689_022497 [Euphorbia peplus]|nr:hypothetical protein M5689_022497 [Euphorbia peplus]